MSGPPTVTRVARTVAEIEELRVEWERVSWGREEAALDYFLARTHARPDVIAPFGVIVSDEDGPQAALAGRIEHRKLSTSVGYRVVYAPRVRYLHVVDGGLIARDRAGVAALQTAIEQALNSGTVDVVGLPPLELGSQTLEAFEAVGGPLGHQPLIAPWTRRRLVLPATFEEFVASRSSNTRWRIRRDTKRLLAAIGDRLRVDVVRDPTGLEQLMRDASAVAQATYQHALGAGFADTPEQRALAEVGLEHGWVRGYLLYLDERPIAYWFCSTYNGTMLIRTAGYDAEHAAHRPGIYLLMRLIEDACSDTTLHTLDFGPGDAAYKQQCSSESVEERNLVLFAPTMRARRINLTRTAILGPVHVARRILDRTKLTERVRARWRGRLREGRST